MKRKKGLEEYKWERGESAYLTLTEARRIDFVWDNLCEYSLFKGVVSHN